MKVSNMEKCFQRFVVDKRLPVPIGIADYKELIDEQCIYITAFSLKIFDSFSGKSPSNQHIL